MDSRTPFVKEVAKTIAERHGRESGSFIFGISGKWGEGKSYFLDDLRKQLVVEDRSFEVFDINPWKFSTDRISFLRNFLRTLYKNDESELKELDIDTSESAINWKQFFCFLLPLALICAISTYSPVYKWILGLSDAWKFCLTVIFLPIVLAVVQSVTVVQKTDHAITTLDKFDDKLNTILAKYKSSKKKIVIFVDDLDRVTAEMARDVLDNLRTFFDKPDITFVVTGDHTVLEGYLGRDLLPDEGVPAQLEEGRRFLKKIFNVYWRLPLPIKKDVKSFIESQLTAKAQIIDGFFPVSEDREKLAHYLELYFDRNFRQIIRFVDKIIFTFKIIKQSANDADEQRGSYFKEMLAHPLLVVRVLMIEELCAPMFDVMVNDVEVLQSLEYAVEKKNSTKINEIIEQHKDSLSQTQKSFISRFLYEEPRFFKESSLQVLDLQPFLSLAADASFGDQRGPSNDDFLGDVTSGDPVRIKNSLLSMGSKKAEGCATAAVSHIRTLPDPANLNALSTVLTALVELVPENPTHKIFGKELAKLDYAFLNNAESTKKMEILNTFWHWLDLIDDQTILDLYKGKFVIADVSQSNAVDLEKAGKFTSFVMTDWLVKYYSQNKEDALSAMVNRFPKLSREVVQEGVETIKDALMGESLPNASLPVRENLYLLAKEHIVGGDELFKHKVLGIVSSLEPNITQWAISKAAEKDPLWSVEDIELAIFKKLKEATDINSLLETLRFAIANKIGSPDSIWPNLYPAQSKLLIDNLAQFIDDASLQAIAPPQAYADQIMDSLIKHIKVLPPEQQVGWIAYVAKGKWLWQNLKTHSLGKKFANLKKAASSDVKNAIDSSEQSWTPPKETEESK